jgi:hypothetical protein
MLTAPQLDRGGRIMKRIPVGIDVALVFNPDLSGSFVAVLSSVASYDGSIEPHAMRILPFTATSEVGLFVEAYKQVDYTDAPPAAIPQGYLNLQYDSWLSIVTDEPDVRPILPTLCTSLSILRDAVEEIESVISEVGYLDDDIPRTAVLRLLANYWVTIRALREANQLTTQQLVKTRERLQEFLMTRHCLPFA